MKIKDFFNRVFKRGDYKKLTWNDVTTRQFFELQKLMKELDGEKEEITPENDLEYRIKIAELFFGKAITDMPLNEFNKQYNRLTFLSEKMETKAPPKELKINGKVYTITCLAGKIPTGQIVEYTEHIKNNDIPMACTAFIVPKGYKYGEGYNLMDVYNDIMDAPCTLINDIANFFAMQWMIYLDASRRCSLQALKKTNLPKKEREALVKVTKALMDMLPTDFSHIS